MEGTSISNLTLKNCFALNLGDPAIVTIAASMGLLLYLAFWLRRYPNTPGQFWLQLASLAMSWWLMALGLEISTTSGSCKVFWSGLAWPGIALVSTGWAFFLYEYALAKRVPGPLRFVCLIAAPLVITGAAVTNGLHGQFYGSDTRLVVEDGRSFVTYEHGPYFYLAVSYIYIMILSTWAMAGAATVKAGAAVRGFFTKLLGITVLPAVANLGYLFGDLRFFGGDPTPFAYSLSVVFVVWLMVDNRWVDVTAMGRDLLYYHSRDPIFIFGLDGRLYDASPEAKDLFGSRPLRPGDSVLGIESIADIYRQLSTKADIDTFPTIRKDNRYFAPRVYPIDLLHVKSKLGWVLALVDVSAQQDATERARAADLAKTQFLATVSHELRTPLTVIVGALKMLNQKNLDIAPDKAAKLIERAFENSRSLAKLVDDLLDVQRIENAEFSMIVEQLDLNALARRAMSRIENYQAGKRVTFELAENDSHIMVQGDRQRLGQVLANVLSNAIKFCGDPGVVKIRLGIDGANACLFVSDNGAGIPEGARDRVFGRFTQVDSSDTRNRGGSGLGMHISQQILRQHNGRIDYESREGAGTTFIVTLPLAEYVPVNPDGHQPARRVDFSGVGASHAKKPAA